MDRDKLVELAERCEAATVAEEYDRIRDAWVQIYGEKANWHPFIDMLALGAFLSAAMMLVPEAWPVRDFSQWTDRWSVDLQHPTRPHCGAQGDARTAGLALCAAALRAHAR